MKPLLINLTLFLTCASFIYSQPIVINIEVSSPKSKEVYISLPVDGVYFPANQQTCILKPDNTQQFTTALEKAGPVTVRYEDILVKLFMQPGDRLALEFSPERKDTLFTITGSNKEGQHLLNKRIQFYEYEARRYIGKDSLISRAVTALQAEKKEETKVYNQLFEEKKITKSFLAFALLNLDYQYAALQASMGVIVYHTTTLPPAHPRYRAHFAQENAAIWEQTYQQFTPNNEKALASFFHFDYTRDYGNFYLQQYLAKKEGTYQKNTAEDYLYKQFTTIRKAFPGNKVQEYLLARFLHMEAYQRNYQQDLIALYDQFTELYPQSFYSPFIQPLIAEIKTYHQIKNQALKADQQIIDNYLQVHSLKQLLGPFKGKTLFVDLWATWCGPCKEEFFHSESLKDYLKGKAVNLLYISMDEDKADEKWKHMIRYYNLSGYHIRTSDALRKDLINLLWEGKGYSIPRYLIIDSKGEIVEMSAFKPSTKEKLYEQLKKYL